MLLEAMTRRRMRPGAARASRWAIRPRRRSQDVGRPGAQRVQQGGEVAGGRGGGVLPVGQAEGGTAAAAQVGQDHPAAPGQLTERLPQVGVVPVGTAVDHQQRDPGRTRGLRDEQFHGGLGGHGHGAFAEHQPSLRPDGRVSNGPPTRPIGVL